MNTKSKKGRHGPLKKKLDKGEYDWIVTGPVTIQS